ncbi:MAG TPA: DUF1501 domain-containing protein [Myxococcales bacterium]|nr:DUF1501 domain-containing protein [Myxococcales bacterium]HIN85278.1 DUF1501 domain-containing protein [Myxococcales bacterium]
MKRRDFLQSSAMASLALMAPRIAFGKSGPELADRLWVFVDANGAWDPTFFCDPQPHPFYVNPAVYTAGQIMTNSQGVSYAPYEDGKPYMVGAGEGQDFFAKYADKLLVINGFDGQTNNHNVGSRSMWSGTLATGNPSLGALIAAAHSGEKPGELPLAFVSTGGYDSTNGLVPATRVGKTAPLIKLTQPNLFKEDNAGTYYHHPAVLKAIREKQAERTDRLIANQGLPQIIAGLKRLKSARAGEDALALLLGPLKDKTLLPEVSTTSSRLLPPARVAMAAMAAGICVSVNLSMRGFDTHSNHDWNSPLGGHRPPLKELFIAIDYVWDRAKALGFDDKLVMVIGSDFGRTRYNKPIIQDGDPQNATAGKDHWPITSMMLMGKDIPPGVIGATHVEESVSGVTAKHVLNANGVVQVSDNPDAAGTTLIRQVHVHHALRCLAGLKEHELGKRYPLARPIDFPLPILPGAPGWESFV